MKRLLALLLAGSLAACHAHAGAAAARTLTEAESRWKAHPVASYHLVIEVDRPDEKRRNDVTVEDGTIAHATTSYWNTGESRWDPPMDLNPDQARPFTVEGFFETIRGEIDQDLRSEIGITPSDTPPFLERVLLGPLRRQPRGTGAILNVESFEAGTAPAPRAP